jgi:hypothetical protein
MNNKNFWSDVLRDGAILGLIMGLSTIFENFIKVKSGMSLPSMSTVLTLEMILSLVLFIWLVYRFTKRRSLSAEPREGFPYGYGLVYVFVQSVLAGVVVGLANTLFIAIVGYDVYVEALIEQMDSAASMLASVDPMSASTSGYQDMVDTLVEGIESSSRPSVFDNILAALNNYIIGGTLLGLIIAYSVRREPEL